MRVEFRLNDADERVENRINDFFGGPPLFPPVMGSQRGHGDPGSFGSLSDFSGFSGDLLGDGRKQGEPRRRFRGRDVRARAAFLCRYDKPTRGHERNRYDYVPRPSAEKMRK